MANYGFNLQYPKHWRVFLFIQHACPCGLRNNMYNDVVFYSGIEAPSQSGLSERSFGAVFRSGLLERSVGHRGPEGEGRTKQTAPLMTVSKPYCPTSHHRQLSAPPSGQISMEIPKVGVVIVILWQGYGVCVCGGGGGGCEGDTVQFFILLQLVCAASVAQYFNSVGCCLSIVYSMFQGFGATVHLNIALVFLVCLIEQLDTIAGWLGWQGHVFCWSPGVPGLTSKHSNYICIRTIQFLNPHSTSEKNAFISLKQWRCCVAVETNTRESVIMDSAVVGSGFLTATTRYSNICPSCRMSCNKGLIIWPVLSH